MLINFIIELFESKERNAICIVINKLTKKYYYIVCTINNKNTIVETTADIFLYNIFKYYSFFTSIIFDREFQFIAII